MEQQINISGQQINYTKVGNGQHCILCFPGALGSIWTDFKPQVENLDRTKFTVVAWDPPGYGYSRPPNRKFTTNFYEEDADVAYKLMQVLGIPKFSLLGWSDGGVSSIILAAKYPDSVRNLVIWGSHAYFKQEDVAEYEKGNDLNTWSDRMKAPFLAIYGEEGLRNLWNGLSSVIKKIYEEGNGNKCKEMFCLVKCPTLVLHGDRDTVIPLEHAAHFLENIKGSKLHRFPDGKHNLHLRYAAEFNELVTEFLEKN